MYELFDTGVRESLLSFVIGQRGCTLLAFQGYNYVKNRRSGVKTYWICAKKGSTKCNARLVTDVVDGVEQIVLESYRHNHAQIVERKKRKSSIEQTPNTFFTLTQPTNKCAQVQLNTDISGQIRRASTNT
ncbi:uncharacterized protein pre-mod(mdg4)-I [Eurosta solidaginis]|uniref:uncharacterized protein pre-mod(mdg4)-I n=1 Tax=Eurosta solidaginis TaxID=178769 RepID=UPI0035305BEB